nr:RNA-directed DNA polymerase, eukaryota, reverse transcriptase zinc-binding domain protein [Tanacetum cinerariifolium]GEW57729.1 RNA-directed DNA polymerase, eukaryota, reverse transcriptase zinc-binding domain protein [Tanacetum cinerariifolium]
MEVFSLLMKRQIEKETRFQNYFGCKAIKLTHIYFADDLLVMCHGDSKSAMVIKNALDEFSAYSGLMPNNSKSSVFFGSLNEEECCEIKIVLLFATGSLLVRSIIRRIAFAVSGYGVWTEIIGRIFKDSKRSCDEVVKSIIDAIRHKLLGIKVKDTSAVRDVERKWAISCNKIHSKKSLTREETENLCLVSIRGLIQRNWKLRLSIQTKSGGLLAGIHGLFSGRYCGLVSKRVTCGYPWPELGGNHRDFGLAFPPWRGVTAMPSHFHKKFRWGTVFETGRMSFIEPRTGLRMKSNCRTRVPIDLYPCHIEEKMTIKEVRGESVMEWKTKMTTKDGIVIKFPRKFRGYKLATEEEVEENERLKEV